MTTEHTDAAFDQPFSAASAALVAGTQQDEGTGS